jgi:hypothetical protein
VLKEYHSNGRDIIKCSDKVTIEDGTDCTAFNLVWDMSLEGASLEQEISYHLRVDVLRQRLAVPRLSRAIW